MGLDIWIIRCLASRLSDGEARKTFMTMDDNLALVRAVNDKAYTYLFDQKCAFNERFHRFLGREWLDLRTADVAAFCRLL